ncbi:ABC transporter permease [Pseudoalteromonas spongiae]|uniref:ABC transporter permease n=1 Tax=Pseudoalteromonas spongiae TaxID=298657 RepID=UPI00110BEE32|nr:ABC transporter permease [Pseudoalteromonas spongiae]TMO83651.1 hypothetical protein CWC15_14430 [Pseudoalteromonas spongiae]
MSKRTIEFIRFKLKSNLKSEVSKNYLGFLWWFFEPLLLLSVFYLVFGILLNAQNEDFASYLIVGVTLWVFFSNTTNNLCGSIQSAAGVLQQIYVPKWTFPVIFLCSHLVKFSFLLLVLVCYLIVSGYYEVSNWLQFIPVLFSYIIFVSGIGMIVASVVPTLPDLRFIVNAGVQLLMFGSGIFYQYSMIPEQYLSAFLINPIALTIYNARATLLDGQSVALSDSLYVAVWGVVTIALSSLLLRKLDRRYPRFIL